MSKSLTKLSAEILHCKHICKRAGSGPSGFPERYGLAAPGTREAQPGSANHRLTCYDVWNNISRQEHGLLDEAELIGRCRMHDAVICSVDGIISRREPRAGTASARNRCSTLDAVIASVRNEDRCSLDLVTHRHRPASIRSYMHRLRSTCCKSRRAQQQKEQRPHSSIVTDASDGCKWREQNPPRRCAWTGKLRSVRPGGWQAAPLRHSGALSRKEAAHVANPRLLLTGVSGGCLRFQ